MPTTELTLFHAPISGNSYKIVLLLSLLQRPAHIVTMDLLGGEVRSAEFRKKNPFGRVPFLVEGDFGLGESNAILLYLARGTPLLPEEPRAMARVQQWMFFEQNQVEISLGVLRLVQTIIPDHPLREHAVAFLRPKAFAALDILEHHLADHPFVEGLLTVADLALFAYVQVAGEADIALEPYPAIGKWLRRIEATPGFVAFGV